MTVEELKELKVFPKDSKEIFVVDRASIKITRQPIPSKNKSKQRFKYKGVVGFTYINKENYTDLYETRSLKGIIEKTLRGFEQRNRQMIGYEKRNL